VGLTPRAPPSLPRKLGSGVYGFQSSVFPALSSLSREVGSGGCGTQSSTSLPMELGSAGCCTQCSTLPSSGACIRVCGILSSALPFKGARECVFPKLWVRWAEYKEQLHFLPRKLAQVDGIYPEVNCSLPRELEHVCGPCSSTPSFKTSGASSVFSSKRARSGEHFTQSFTKRMGYKKASIASRTSPFPPKRGISSCSSTLSGEQRTQSFIFTFQGVVQTGVSPSSPILHPTGAGAAPRALPLLSKEWIRWVYVSPSSSTPPCHRWVQHPGLYLYQESWIRGVCQDQY
jgi:hypothetical protein